MLGSQRADEEAEALPAATEMVAGCWACLVATGLLRLLLGLHGTGTYTFPSPPAQTLQGAAALPAPKELVLLRWCVCPSQQDQAMLEPHPLPEVLVHGSVDGRATS